MISTDLKEASKKIIKNIMTVETLINEQAASVLQTLASVKEIIANIRAIELTTKNKQELSESLLQIARDSEKSMEENYKSFNEIKGSSEIILKLIKVIDVITA